MTKRTIIIVTAMILTTCFAALVFFTFGGAFKAQKNQEFRQTKLIIPGEANPARLSRDHAEQTVLTETLMARAPMGEGEVIVSVLNLDFDGNASEEQFIAYRNIHEIEGPIYVCYVEYDEKSRSYVRTWSTPTAATRPGTVSLFTMDLIGDRSVCALLAGMNSQDEHTMSIFRLNKQMQLPRWRGADSGPPFEMIAQLQIEGIIRVNETERSQAYQLGIAKGQSFTITAYGHDPASANILDQIETNYAYNEQERLYERIRVTRIPGSQVEQRRLRELLGGTRGVFENFIDGLWYYVSPEGTLDSRQYIYFDPNNRELIFYGEEAQQVFNWQNSIATRYGLYISGYNVSVATLRRSLDIELESLDSLRVKVFEDVRLKIGVSTTWDGSYRRAETKSARLKDGPVSPYIDAVYDTSQGRLRFFPSGEYALSSGASLTKGWYVFFQVNDQELLEMRPDTGNLVKDTMAEDSRLVYRVDRPRKTENSGSPGNMSLSRVRLGVSGIHELHEGAIIMTSVGNRE